MSSAVNELLVAIQARLEGDAGLAALIGGGGMRDRRARGRDRPARVRGGVDARGYWAARGAGCGMLLTREAGSAEGRRETEAIGHAVRGLLDDADLALAAHALVSLRHRRTVSRREANTGFFVAEMAFRAVVE